MTYNEAVKYFVLIGGGIAAIAYAIRQKRKVILPIVPTYQSSTMSDSQTSNISVETSNLPRGYRNHNPLNIRYNAANKWLGKVYDNTDKVHAFEQFINNAYGYRAALYLLRKYINRDGLHTVAELISKWAPNNENNTTGYINRVCSTTGFYPGTVIDPTNREQMLKLVYAMALVENGNTPLPDYSEIEAGWELL